MTPFALCTDRVPGILVNMSKANRIAEMLEVSADADARLRASAARFI